MALSSGISFTTVAFAHSFGWVSTFSLAFISSILCVDSSVTGVIRLKSDVLLDSESSKNCAEVTIFSPSFNPDKI